MILVPEFRPPRSDVPRDLPEFLPPSSGISDMTVNGNAGIASHCVSWPCTLRGRQRWSCGQDCDRTIAGGGVMSPAPAGRGSAH